MRLIFWFTEKLISPGHKSGTIEIDADPIYPDRSLNWASILLPYWSPLHTGDYLFIPNNGRTPKAITAAKALAWQDAAVQLSYQATFDQLNLETANRMHKLTPDARLLTYSVFRLEPGFAQALRIYALETHTTVHTAKSNTVSSMGTAGVA